MWLIPESRIEEEFTELDKDGSGYIDVEELTIALEAIFNKYGLEDGKKSRAAEKAREKAKLMLKTADKNADGKISFDEFKKAFAV